MPRLIRAGVVPKIVQSLAWRSAIVVILDAFTAVKQVGAVRRDPPV